jgi:hypothetical protein
MSFDHLFSVAVPHAASTVLAAMVTTAPLAGLGALVVVAIVFFVLAWRYAGHERPFDLRCGPFRLRCGLVPDDTS